MSRLGQPVAAVVNELDVGRLAAWENRRLEDPVGPEGDVPSTNADLREGGAEGWQAYWPVGADQASPAALERTTNFRMLGATAVGTTLMVRFARPEDPLSNREYLLALDVSDWSADDMQVASGRVLQELMEATDSANWDECALVSISRRVAVVAPARRDRPQV